jgi:hypothetical protein
MQGVRRCRQYGGSYLLLKGCRLRATLTARDSGGMSREAARQGLATVDYYGHVLMQYSDGKTTGFPACWRTSCVLAIC